MDPSKQVEKKLALSLDELIAAQKKKQKQTSKPAAKAAKKKAVAGPARAQTKNGSRVLVVPRPKSVPRPGGSGKAAAGLKGTRGGGVHKGNTAPKYVGGPQARQASNRNVKVTIGNKLSGRPAHIPTTGVLSKPFVNAARGGGNGGGRAPMRMDAPSGGSLANRFDSLAGAGPSGPVGRPAQGGARRNVHGVLLP